MGVSDTLPLHVLVERRPSGSPWRAWSWRIVAAVPAADDDNAATLLQADGQTALFRAATLALTLNRDETAHYRQNLSGEGRALYVIAHLDEVADRVLPLRPVRITASPDEAQAYADGADTVVEPVPIPPAVGQWILAFVCRYEAHDGGRGLKRQRRPSEDRLAARSGPVVVPPSYRVPGA